MKPRDPDVLIDFFRTESQDVCTGDELLARTTRPDAEPRRPRRWPMTSLAAAAVTVLVAVAVVLLRLDSSPRAAESGVATQPRISTPPLKTSSASPAAANALTLRLTLDRSTQPANGEPIHGTIELINNTGHPVTIPDACNLWLQVALANALIKPMFIDTLIACRDGSIPVGVTLHPVTIVTTYSGCMPSGRLGGGAPRCIGPENSDPPPLPPGAYRTVIDVRVSGIEPANIIRSTPTVTLTSP